MSISVSNRAAKRIHQLQEANNITEESNLRVGVVSGGCSGLTYELDFENGAANASDEDKIFEVNGVKLIVDMRSFLYLSGTELDFTEGLEGEGFHFHNPNATRTCSCGESFSV